MNLAIGPITIAVLVEGAAAVLLGGYLLSRRVGLAGINSVALRIAVFGLFAAGTQLSALGVPTGTATRLFAVMTAVNYAVAFTTLLAYPDGLRTAWKRRLFGLCSFPPLLAASLLVFQPNVLVDENAILTPVGAYFVFGIGPLFHFLAIVVFGGLYLRSTPGARRTQLLYVTMPHLFFGLHDGLLFTMAGLGRSLLPGTAPTAALVLSGLTLLSVPIFLVLAWLRPGITERSRDDRTLVLSVLLFAPLAPLQFVDTTLGVHLLVDLLMIVILFYGVARYGSPDVDLSLRSNVSRGTVAAAAIALLFIAQQVVEQLAGRTLGLAAGAMAAGLVLAALYPLQRWLEGDRFHTAKGGRGEVTSAYEDFRRMEIYKAAMESAAKDGVITKRERDVLLTLQRQLRITPADAEAMERDVVGGRA